MRELKEGKSPEEVSRYENLEELLNAIKVFTESAETNGEPSILEAYMANVALLTDQDTENEEDRNKVTLMTMHSAKGLEFKHVYIVGMEDTLFPSPMSSGSARELEEERRLFYVGLHVQKSRQLSAMHLTGINGEIWRDAVPAGSLGDRSEVLCLSPDRRKTISRIIISRPSKPSPISEEPLSYAKNDRFKKIPENRFFNFRFPIRWKRFVTVSTGRYCGT